MIFTSFKPFIDNFIVWNDDHGLSYSSTHFHTNIFLSSYRYLQDEFDARKGPNARESVRDSEKSREKDSKEKDKEKEELSALNSSSSKPTKTSTIIPTSKIAAKNISNMKKPNQPKEEITFKESESQSSDLGDGQTEDQEDKNESKNETDKKGKSKNGGNRDSAYEVHDNDDENNDDSEGKNEQKDSEDSTAGDDAYNMDKRGNPIAEDDDIVDNEDNENAKKKKKISKESDSDSQDGEEGSNKMIQKKEMGIEGEEQDGQEKEEDSGTMIDSEANKLNLNIPTSPPLQIAPSSSSSSSSSLQLCQIESKEAGDDKVLLACCVFFPFILPCLTVHIFFINDACIYIALFFSFIPFTETMACA